MKNSHKPLKCLFLLIWTGTTVCGLLNHKINFSFILFIKVLPKNMIEIRKAPSPVAARIVIKETIVVPENPKKGTIKKLISAIQARIKNPAPA